MERLKMLNYLKQYIDKKKVVTVLFLLGLCTVLSVVYPFIYKFFIDRVLLKKDFSNFKYVLLFMILWIISNFFVKRILGRTKAIFLTDTLYKIKSRLLEHILCLDLNSYLKTTPNEYKRVLEDDSKEIEQFFSIDIFNYLVCVFTACLLIIIMFLLSPILLLSCMAFFVISYFETQYIKKKVIKNAVQLRNTSSLEDHLRSDEVANYKEIKYLNYEQNLDGMFTERSVQLIKLHKREKVFQYINKYFGALNHDLITRFFIYIVGGILVIRGNFTTSSFLVFLGFYEVFVKNIRQIIDSNFSYNNRKNKLENVVKYLHGKNEVAVNTEELHLENITFKSVSFKYRDNKAHWILRDTNIKFSAPNTYLIHGKSGIGKSTILKLLYKEQMEYEGQIFFDNVELAKLNTDQKFYKLFAIATSDSKIFNSSIRDNLLLVNEDATDEELEIACRKALFWDDINRMPFGLDSEVGENASKLSGGQKERLVMARLFLANDAQIYILDEALAEVSVNDEVAIINQLQNTRPNSIILIVSHRLIKVDNAKKLRL